MFYLKKSTNEDTNDDDMTTTGTSTNCSTTGLSTTTNCSTTGLSTTGLSTTGLSTTGPSTTGPSTTTISTTKFFAQERWSVVSEMFTDSSSSYTNNDKLEYIKHLASGFDTLTKILGNFKAHSFIKTEKDIRDLAEEWEDRLNDLRQAFLPLKEQDKEYVLEDRYLVGNFDKYMDIRNDEECFCVQCFVNKNIISMEEKDEKEEKEETDVSLCACGNKLSPSWNDCDLCDNCCKCQGNCPCNDKHCNGDCGTQVCGVCVDVCRCGWNR